MHQASTHRSKKHKHSWSALLGLAAWLFHSAALAALEPAQTPLLSTSMGAKPNLMIAMDNSLHMTDPYHFSYTITSDSKASPKGWCPGPNYKGRNALGLTTQHDDWAGPAGNCTTELLGLWTGTAAAPEKRYNPEEDSPWHAQRSADVNPVYYNPRVTYHPRVQYDGTPVPVTDGAVFVSNADSVRYRYCYSLRNNKRGYSFRKDGAGFSSLTGWFCKLENPLEWDGDQVTAGIFLTPIRVPEQKEHKTTNNNTPAFTWATCDSPRYSWDLFNFFGRKEVGCRWKHIREEVITPSRTSPVTLPSNHQRTDCGDPSTTTCSVSAEITNILNWHRYYFNNASSAATSIGLALANPLYRGKLRVGYFSMNQKAESLLLDGSLTVGGIRNNHTPGRTYIPDETRGVRLSNPANDQELFKWLYEDVEATRGTPQPIRNALDEVQKYYQGNYKENPWALDPSKPANPGTNPELSCRRSFTVLFSNGVDQEAWNEIQNGEFDYPSSRGMNPRSATSLPLFQGYDRAGYPTDQTTRRLYTPYGNHRATSGARTLSDLTAKYYWHTDFRSGVANEVVARPGQPTTWQNFATYTVGYHIRPSGDLPFRENETPIGLRADEVEKYKRDWILYGAAAAKPTWPQIGAWASALGTTDHRKRIDDFFQAGFTGGGAGFAVSTPDDIYRAFDTILAEIVNYSGNESGTAVSGMATTDATMEGLIKYNITYRLADNSGVLHAVRMDAHGINDEKSWTSSDDGIIPDYNKRITYMLDKNASGYSRYAATHDTALNDLGGINGRIDPYNRLNKNSFMRYLLGDDLAPNLQGGIYRTRNAPLASSVNTPPLFAGARVNMGYAREEIASNNQAASAVPGRDSYIDFYRKKWDLPPTLYVGTNAGMIHVLNVAPDEAPLVVAGKTIPTGQELGSYIVRGSMSKLEKYADPHYRFQYLMDGPLVEHDIYNTSNQAWQQMIYGTTGRGGQSIFGLQVPHNTDNRVPGLADYRWEVDRSDAGYERIAYITNPPQAGATTDGQFVLVSTSGHYDKDQRYGLYILDANSGSLLKFIELPSTARGPGVGLGGVTLLRNAQRQIVGAYAGDASGNLWRFNLSGPIGNWRVSNGKPLYTTPTVQPIYAAPAWQAHPGAPGEDCQGGQPGACGTIVVFATGILLEDSHRADISEQAIYGIWDNTPVGQHNDEAYKDGTYTMVEQTITTSSGLAGKAGTIAANKTYYKSSSNPLDWTKNRGWFMKLSKLPNTEGERVIGDLWNLGNSVFVASVIINNLKDNGEACVAEPASPPNVLYGLNALTGAHQRSFDQDGDDKADDFTLAYLPEGGYSRSPAMTLVRPKNEIDLFDPNLRVGVGDPKEGDLDLKVSQRPAGNPAYLSGATDSIKLYNSNPDGWIRAWRSVQELPETLR